MSLTQRLRAQSGRGEEPRRRLLIKEIEEPAAALDGLDTIGTALRAARLSLQLDLGTVARDLRIKRQHIEALEENDLAELPATTYALGFVRSYATYLRLDPDECVRRFKAELKAQQSHSDHHAFHFPQAKSRTWLPQGSLFVLLALLGIGIYAGWYVSVTTDRATATRVPPVPERLAEAAREPSGQRPLTLVDTPPEVVATQPAEGVLSEPENEATAVGGPSLQVELDRAPSANVPETQPDSPDSYALIEDGDDTDLGALLPSNSEIEGGDLPTADETPLGRVVLRAREKTWVRVEDANSQILIQQELESGEGYLVPNRPGLILSVRDAGALEVFIDGEAIGLLGRPGEALPAVSLDPAALKANRAS